MPDVVVVGAGIAGLACASALRDAGAEVVVVDKGRGVGGRAATRRVDGQPVDHGLGFYHGRDPAFLAALDAVGATPLPGWPLRTAGAGTPCQPAAFETGVRRLAFVEGLTAFPKHLGRGIPILTGFRATRVENDRVLAEDGRVVSAPTLVFALPAEQSTALLWGVLPAGPLALLRMAVTHPCWSVIARYDGPDDPLPFDALYPEGGVVQTVLHDSSKRPMPRTRVLVIQGTAPWSAAHLERAPEEVIPPLLAEAARHLGPWAGAPRDAVAHRWRYGRVDGGLGFASPLLVGAPGGVRVGLAGEAFDPAAGAEGAFRAGRALAARMRAAAAV